MGDLAGRETLIDCGAFPVDRPFNPERFPLTAAYMADLPGGVSAHPECQVRTTVSREILTEFPDLLEREGIHADMVRTLRNAVGSGQWMPETLGVALRLATRDVMIDSDTKYLEWTYDVSSRVFAERLYRVLMYVLSPTLVLLGAGRRWNAFRSGTTLTATIEQNGGKVELSFPPNLYPELILRGFGEAFRASLVAARARDPHVVLTGHAIGSARWDVTWR
jgi:hypothetical protein